MLEFIKKILSNLTSEQIALISILVTVLLYSLNKRNELKFKKHELKKEKYMQFVSLLKETYLNGGEIFSKKEYKEKFFDFGSTIFIYGSKKMYRKYCFFREFSNEFIHKMKYYDKDIVLYLVADLLNQIRKEVGMYNFEYQLGFKSISFFTNDIYFNPTISTKWWKLKIKVFLIKFELLLYKVEYCVIIKILFSFFKIPFQMILLLVKYIFLIPLGRLLIKLGIDKKIKSS